MFLLTVLFFGAACVAAAGAATHHDSALGDRIIYYYKDGNSVVVRACAKRPAPCAAPENRVGHEVFVRALQRALLIGSPGKLSPISLEEIDSYLAANRASRSANLDPAALEKREGELRGKISGKPFSEGETEELREVRARLAAAKAKAARLEKVEVRVAQLAEDQLAASSESAPGSVSQRADRRAFHLFRRFDRGEGECGSSKGPQKIEDRSRDCGANPNSNVITTAGERWSLVSRTRNVKTGQFYEVWWDRGSGLLWGDRLDEAFSHYDAVTLDATGKVLTDLACNSEQGRLANGGIGERKFGLPTAEELQAADAHGLREVLPNLVGEFFWSSSLISSYPGYAFGMGGDAGHISPAFRRFKTAVRCVGRDKI